MGLINLFSGKKDEQLKIANEERTSALLRPLAYDPENKIFVLDGSAIAFAYQCLPLNGTSEGLQERIKELLQRAFPHGTIMQFCLFRSPDIEQELMEYKSIRPIVNPDKQLMEPVNHIRLCLFYA